MSLARPKLRGLYAKPPLLVPMPVAEDSRLDRGQQLVWHREVEKYGAWTSYHYRAMNGPYERRSPRGVELVVDVLAEVDYFRCRRGESCRNSVAVPAAELWTVAFEPNDGYEPATDGGPVPASVGVVSGHRVPVFDPAVPPVRRLHLATSVDGLTGLRAWLMPHNGDAPVGGYRVVSEPVAHPLGPEYEAMGLSVPAQPQVGVAVPLVAESLWWAAHDDGHPVHPNDVRRAALVGVLVEIP